ncbi:hypothetical protein [Rhodopirellula bahusiensis]|uniref:hypothetical protein n=1 Tax=Rhodopirellula bahusiensis TaxID=2014065 RepID=UPI00326416F3
MKQTARHKLNQYHLCNSLVVGLIFGAGFGSFPVGILVVVILVGIDVQCGLVRPNR